MSDIVFTQQASSMSAAPAGKTYLYAKNDGKMYSMDPAGNEYALTSPGTFPANSILSVYRNRLINGDFSQYQRSVTSVADDVYNLDRWYTLTESGSVTIAQQFDQENIQSTNIRMTQPDGVAKRIGLAQIIESANIRHLKGQSVTLSGRIRTSVSAPIRFAIIETTTADVVTSDFVNTWTSTNYTNANFFIAGITIAAVGVITPVANNWTPFSLTASLTSNMKNVSVMIWTEGALATTNTLDLGLLQLESGSTVSSFEYKPYGIERQLCQRYYFSSFPQGTAPAYNVASEAMQFVNPPAYQSDNAGYAGWCSAPPVVNFSWPAQMRVAPTIITYNPLTATAAQFYHSTGGALAWGSIISSKNHMSAGTAQSSVTSVVQLTSFHMTADSEL